MATATARIPRASRPLVLMSAASVVAAVVHGWVAPEHFGESALYGAFFVGTAVAGSGYAALVLTRPTRGVLFAGVGGNAAIVALWLVTRLVAVPLGPGAGETEPFGALDVLATGAELVAVVAALVALAGVRRAGSAQMVAEPAQRRRNLTVPRLEVVTAVVQHDLVG